MQGIKKGDRVLITGGTGSLGRALAVTLAHSEASVRIFSRDEKKQYDMKQEFPDYEYVLGDVRDFPAVAVAVKGMTVVIHAASLKYVNVSEVQPTEYAKTNVDGTINVLWACRLEGGVRRCVGISSDKACEPVNTYGLTKAILEKLFLEAAVAAPEDGCRYTVARYGNVAGTRGSVIPFWAKCLKAGEPIPVTNARMTRFFFTMGEAINLIGSALSAENGAVVSKRMSSVQIIDLAEVMAAGQPGRIQVIGGRPGEKMHESLLSIEEMARTKSQGTLFTLRPNMEAQHSKEGFEPYTSDRARRLFPVEIDDLLRSIDIEISA